MLICYNAPIHSYLAWEVCEVTLDMMRESCRECVVELKLCKIH
ncbi:hypothetical protein [Helicobacter pylori]|nr:hypothetical protein [Helicobacter pylori]